MARTHLEKSFERIWESVASWGILVIAVCTLASTSVTASEYFVATDHPNASDSNSGLLLDQPFKTLNRGVQHLVPGDTLSIREGVYRETMVNVPGGTPQDSILIRAYPGDEGRVVIRGSDVITGWINDGGDVWSVSWQPLPPIIYPDNYIEYGELTTRRELVFIDGVQLQQVLLQSELVSGSFWMDDVAGRIRINYPGNPNTSEVEIAVRTNGVVAQASHNIFRGLRVEHVSTELTVAAMHLGPDQRVEDCRVEYNNGNGVTAYDRSTFIRSSFSHNGRVGVVLAGDDSLLESSETSYNSWRYGPRWHAGGVKLTGNDPSNNRIIRHTARFNNGRGVWFDTAGPGNRVESSFFEGNVVAGIQFEAAEGPNEIINNVILETMRDPSGNPPDNGSGIVLYEAMDTDILNNTIADVSGTGIVITGGLRDGRYSVNTEVYNNIVVNSGVAALRIAVRDTSREPAIVASHHFDNNLFDRNPDVMIYPVLSTLYGLYHWSLSEWQANQGEDLNSLAVTPMFTGAESNDYSLQAGSPAIDAGTYLAVVMDDFAGNSRPQDVIHDIGAFECSASEGCGGVVFISGFESGDLSGWGEVAP